MNVTDHFVIEVTAYFAGY